MTMIIVVLSISTAVFALALVSLVIALRNIANRVKSIEENIGRIEGRMAPLWARLQAKIALDLHHPHPRYFEMDTLLEKLESLHITASERDRLKELCIDRGKDFSSDISDEQRKEAVLMVIVMDLVVIESSGNIAASNPPEKRIE